MVAVMPTTGVTAVISTGIPAAIPTVIPSAAIAEADYDRGTIIVRIADGVARGVAR